MPTIDALDPALAVADTDEFMLTQAGIARRASRAQLVAGLQPQIALATGQLLGRVSPATGAVEPVALGANLRLAAGVLSASPPALLVASLPAGNTPGPADLVPAGQGGGTVAIAYAQFMAGIAGLPGIDASALAVRPAAAAAAGISVARRLADIASDAVPIEAFGAAGDGQTDDTAALVAALASGHPVRLGARTYVVAGQFTVGVAGAVLIGTPGQSVLKRLTQVGNGAWIAIQAPGFRADGVTFDANRAGVAQDSWGVLVTSLCTSSDFQRCAFLNAAGAVLGSGLVFQASDPVPVEHVVRDCEFAGNAAHGLWAQACAGVLVEGSRAHDNGQYGFCLDYNDATFRQKLRLAQVTGCRAWNNARGISVGNFNATNAQPPVWGNANPDAIGVVVSGNVCHDNVAYGIAAAGSTLAIVGNLLSNNGVAGTTGAGLLANVAHSRVSANMIAGAAQYGIDCGGAIFSDIAGNTVNGSVIGINCGGSTALRVSGNAVENCASWAMLVNNIDADGNGQTFGIPCTLLAITGNTIAMDGPSATGILLRDGPQNVRVAGNAFVGTSGANVGNALWANTDSILVEGNTWNATGRFTANPVGNAGMQTIVFPDIAETLMVTATNGPVQSLVSAFQVLAAAQVTFIRVTAGGSGYTRAAVAIGGSGAGASAVAVVANGAVIGVAVTAPGTGYGAAGSAVSVAITGDGTGAQASGYAGVPLPEERRLRIRCNGAVTFARSGSQPAQENWTLADLVVPANGDVDWVATYGQWRAVRATPAMLAGMVGATGHGSPEGVVTGPPGSDYRNLDGGAGATLWVKRTGAGPAGWFAVA